ncbi:MAG: hypothetical protein ABI413_14705 [Ktedonobacteraceae bacterium]
MTSMHAKRQQAHAILPSRLDWLCQPENIEHTLRHIFWLNAWKKAHHSLLYGDRQGLQEAQALVLEHASGMGMIQPVAYLDGTTQFPGALLLETVGENAARSILIHLHSLNDPDIWPPFMLEGDRMYRRFILPLYRRITGQDFSLVTGTVHALELEPLHAFLQRKVEDLVERATKTRQPISLRRLATLCIAPVDVLPIRENRLYFLDSYETWVNLDSSDLRKLDPEGESQITFQYTSPTAEYVFHLPLRRAAHFLPAEQLRELQRAPGSSQERGLCQGKVIDEAEGLQYPATEILQNLGVNIVRVCPRKLISKAVYLVQPAVRDILWPMIGRDAQDWTDDPWDGLCLPPSEL